MPRPDRGADADFSAFVAARSHALLRTAYLLTGDRGHAEDLLQTALGRTYLAWGRIADPARREAYVRQVLVREQVNWWRRLRNREVPHASLPETTVGDSAAAIAERDAMLRALATIPARQRAVLVLRYFDDLSEAQAAAALGCPIGTVKTLASRGLARLRAHPEFVVALATTGPDGEAHDGR